MTVVHPLHATGHCSQQTRTQTTISIPLKMAWRILQRDLLTRHFPFSYCMQVPSGNAKCEREVVSISCSRVAS